MLRIGNKTVRDTEGNLQTVPSAAHGKGKRWRARYVDENGREHAKGFARKSDAQSWVDTEITAKFATGTYVDPQRGRTTSQASQGLVGPAGVGVGDQARDGPRRQ